ncbi:ATP-binding protein [Cephaloticoccus primus]|uniref:ATP-binding protein n=1 Tax=Cephaloticoccus primus TaxID=1548207 RepID=UPI0009EF2538|nr:ATP-binding protein [Cephaloticoccus primus]
MNPSVVREYGKINASPTKEFFVSMLTRDISLEDAILDLLDNCIDGILRNKLAGTGGEGAYQNYYSQIVIESDYFSISDNCGGIPWSQRNYAFRMGRPTAVVPDELATVGVYGIGMKRAIFKMGRECSIQTRNREDSYRVDIDDAWLMEEDNWQLTTKPSELESKEEGTTIVIRKLLPGVAEEFYKRGDSFRASLSKAIETHYSAIIEKGFNISINKVSIKPNPVKLAFAQDASTKGIRPYILSIDDYDGVAIFMAVGFTRPIPDENEGRDAIENPKYDSDHAGWTIVCNDRVVLYCDKSEKTGWGVGGVPRYHPQFIAISGIVEFVSTDSRKLPTVTTKRGLDMGSSLYLQIRDKMIEAMKMFTNFTNSWKKDTNGVRRQIKEAPLLSLSQLKAYSKENKKEFRSLRRAIRGAYLKPDLPTPEKHHCSMRQISFYKPVDQIATVSNYLFGKNDHGPSEVGEKCFNNILEETKSR